jgi:serine/threonine protein phosphatase PrpC
VKTCPTCGAAAADDDVFCEVDGDELVATPEGPRARSVAITQAPAALTSDQPTLPVVPLSAKLGVCDVVGARGVGDFVLRGAHGEMTLALGAAGTLVGEARVLQALGGVAPFPALVDDGNAADAASFVAMSAPRQGSRRLVDVALSFTIREALGVARSLVDAAARVESTGYGWRPDPGDVWVAADGSISLARVRGAERLDGSRLDARAVLEAIGPVLVPGPLVRGAPRLLHLMLPNVDAGVARDTDATRAELEAVLAELDAPPDQARVAAVRDAGLRRDHNEDAFALASRESMDNSWAALVVCDGVSASAHADQASELAAVTVCAALARFAHTGDREAPDEAMTAAIRAAHAALCAAQFDRGADGVPGTTLVGGFVSGGQLTVGWVGDSRAYFVSETGGEQLTQDHSWAGEAVARGEMTPAEAMRAPLAHALTRCLGPLEDDACNALPDVRSCQLSGPGYVVLCTDGFWNYFSEASAVAALVHELGPRARPAAIARHLVNHALACGGHDNVTVAVYEHSP